MIYFIFKKLTVAYIDFADKIKDLDDNTYKKVTLIYLSDIMYHFTMWLSHVIEDIEYLKLNKRAIREYYDVYGFDDTLRRFKLSEEVLKRIIE